MELKKDFHQWVYSSDDALNKIFFVRDPLGQKPLFYSFVKNSLIISSEIKDIIYIYLLMEASLIISSISSLKLIF